MDYSFKDMRMSVSVGGWWGGGVKPLFEQIGATAPYMEAIWIQSKALALDLRLPP